MTTPTERPVVAVAAIVFDPAGGVLLIERGRPPGLGLWTVPGGKVEPGESLAQAVAREVAEETGLAVAVGPLVVVVERIFPTATGATHYVILDYLARRLDPTAIPIPADDARAARFVAEDELAGLPLTDGLTAVIAQARRLADADPDASPATPVANPAQAR